MLNRKLKKQLKLWQKNELITDVQADKILEFMKERQKENFFRLLKWLMILGTIWFAFGLIVTIISVLELDILHKLVEKLAILFAHIWQFIYPFILLPIHNYIIHPICVVIEKIFGENRYYFYFGTLSFILAFVFFFVDSKLKPNKQIDSFNLTDEQKNVLKTNWVLSVLFCLFLTSAFSLYNMCLLPFGDMISDNKMIPLWNILGAITFIGMAYKWQKNIYLVFGIYFVALSVGMFAGYDFACYWLGVSRPLIQIFMGVILLLVAYISQLKTEIKEHKDENAQTYIQEKFAGTYNWTGLLLLFTALWITSFWGFDLNMHFDDGSVFEIWVANILFIAASVGAMFYGSKTEQNIFFNYGLTFLIIETYTICGRLASHLPEGLATLMFGGLLIITAKYLKKVYLKKKISKDSRACSTNKK